MFHFLPDYVMPYAIHLLAHDPDMKEHDNVDALKNIKEWVYQSFTKTGFHKIDINVNFVIQ